MSDDFFAEIQESFLHEAIDLLTSVEALSLRVEKNDRRDEAFEELARLAHNFKGSGKAVGFEHISKFGHRIEDLILGIKGGLIAANETHLSLLFKCLDRLQNDIHSLLKDRTLDLNHDQLISEIESTLQGKTTAHQSAPAPREQANQQEVSQEIQTHPSIEEILAAAQASESAQVPQSPQETARPVPAATHETQTPPAAAPSKATKNNEMIRIPKSKIDFLLECFGEQVILQSTLEQCKYDLKANADLIMKTISQLTKLTFELQSHALSLSMVQLGPTFTKLERAIRDASVAVGKEIQVQFVGTETEVDKTLIDSLSDALTHMVRNAVDHGIEDEMTRLGIGKSKEGHLEIRAQRVGSQIWFEIKDDGKGLDPDKLAEKAVGKGLISPNEAARMSRDEKLRLIFRNGFSTKEQVSEISGRGVGMNVVEEAVAAMKGQVEIQSELQKGTIFRLKLPLTLSIFNGALIRIHQNRFIVPTSEITEIAKVKVDDSVHLGRSRRVIKIRDEIYELIDLRDKFKSSGLGSSKKSEETELPILMNRKQKNVAFVVDEIIGMQKVVLRPLGEEVKATGHYTAATILADGSPGVILNLDHIIGNAA